MKKLRIVFVVLFSLCLMAAMSISAYADVIVVQGTGSTSFFSVGDVTAVRGERVVIPVTLQTNPGFTYIKVGVEYDSDALCLVGVTNGDVCADFTKGNYYIWSADTDVTKTGIIMYLVFDVTSHADFGHNQVKIHCVEFTNYNEDSYRIQDANGIVDVYCNHREPIYPIPGNLNFVSIIQPGDVVSPTCTTPGYTIERCPYCQEVLNKEYSAPLGHTYTAEVTAPTCTAMGYTTYTCQTCNDSYVADYTDATGHTYTAVVTNPTCTAMGYTTYACACGESYVADYVDATGHTYTSITTAPTCTASGFTTYSCTCGDIYVADYIDAVGHTYVPSVTAPTCTSMGFTTYTCSCSAFYVADYTDALGHDYDAVVTAPTCTAVGYTTYSCACGDRYVSDYVSANGHTYAKERTASTCTAMGYTTYTCACGDSYVSDYTDAKGHNHLAEVTAPTCSAMGYTTYTCVCGDTFVADYTNAKGHTYQTKVTPPTCTEHGYTTFECSCGDTYIAEYQESTGHEFGSEWSVQKEATITEEGLAVRSCAHTGCKETEEKVLPAKNLTQPILIGAMVLLAIGLIVAFVLIIKNKKATKPQSTKNAETK